MQKESKADFTLPADTIVRHALLTDAPVVCGFIADLEETTLDPNRFASIFRLNLANPMIHYLVAERNQSVIGFLSCHTYYPLHHSSKVGEIQELYVRPDCRNQQVGHLLLNALTELAEYKRVTQLEVTTNQKRADAIRFYERELFQCTHYKLVKLLQP